VLVGVETSDILAPENLTKLRDMAGEMEKVAGVSSITSITGMPEMSASEDGVVVGPLIPEIPADKAAAAALKERMLKARQVVGELVSADFTSALVPVMMYEHKVAEAYPKVEEIARKAAGPGFKVYFHGAPAIERFLGRGGDSLMFPGIAAGLIFLIALFMGLGPRRIPAWLLVVAPAAAAGMAAPVLLRLQSSELSMASGLGAFVYGTFAVFSFPGFTASGEISPRFRWWRRSLLTGSALLAFIFATLVGSSTLPLRGLGAGMAAAVLVVGLIAPYAVRFGAAFAVGGAKARTEDARAFRFGWAVVLVPVLLAACIVLFSPRPPAANDLADTFGSEAEPLQAVKFLDRRFGGSEYLTVAATGDCAHPGFLRTLDGLADSIRTIPGVAGAVSPTDVFKMINEAMIGQYRIPDTIGQMESLWFFLEGQPELGALMYKREQGVAQIRLSPEGAKRSAEVIAEIQKQVQALPANMGHVDIRLADKRGASVLRMGQLDRVEKALSAELGEKYREQARTVLGSVEPLELKPASDSPDPRIKAAFAARLESSLKTALFAYFGSPAAPMALSSAQIAQITGALLAGNPGIETLLGTWFPGDDAVTAKIAGTIRGKAGYAQEKALAGFMEDELKTGMTPVAAAALSDFLSPHVFVDAGRREFKFESVTPEKFEVSGYPVIAPALARETYADLGRMGFHAAVAALLVVILAFATRRGVGASTVMLALLAAASALAWQAGWIRFFNWSLGMQSFIPFSVALAAAAGAWLVAAFGGGRRRDLVWAVLMTAAPLLAMTFAGFAPVRNLMGMCVFGIAGAGFAGWLTLRGVDGAGAEKTEEGE
jgi:predicted RND superfamily exporter protein